MSATTPKSPTRPQAIAPKSPLDKLGLSKIKFEKFRWTTSAVTTLILVVLMVLAEYWGKEPEKFDVVHEAMERAEVSNPRQLATGFIYASTLVHVAEVLLKKPGGFLSNDMFPPGKIEDNMPNWELGALTALRDATTSLRNNIARAQSQSKEDPDLAKAEPSFYFDHMSWAFPASEAEYEKAVVALTGYMGRLQSREAQFYSRADNLRQYLEIMEKRLGSLSLRLSANSENFQRPSLDDRRPLVSKTPWADVDDVFYEARGYTWTAMHVLKAVEQDFKDILQNKTSLVSLQTIIRELEDAQIPTFTSVILNGSGYGVFANYSLTLANYIARANAATLDLRNLLQQG